MTSHLMATSPYRSGVIHAREPLSVTAACGVLVHATSTFAYFDPAMSGVCPGCVHALETTP